MKKDVYYFQHDYNARNDPKIIKLMMVHGVAGVGIFWCIVEQLYQNGGKLPMEQLESIAFALHTDCKCIASVVQDFGLFQNDGESFWSESINTRLNKSKEVTEARKKAANARWKNANAMQVQCKSDALNNKSINNNSCIKIQESEKDFSPKVDFAKIIDLYHSICKSYPRILKLSDDRKRKVEIRFLDEMKGDFALLETVFKKMEASKFLRGDNPRGWKATFDWLFTNAKNWVKVAEGNYDNRDEKPMKGVINKDCNEEWT